MDLLNRKVRIFIADTENILGEKLSDFLNQNGFDARPAKPGVDVRLVLTQFQPDFIFFDLMYPDLNGLDLLRWAQTLPEADRPRIAIMSGHNNPTNVKEAWKLGAIDYLIKPVKPTDVLERLVFHMQKKREMDAKKFPAGDRESALYYMHLTDLALREALQATQTALGLHRLTKMMAISLKAVRVSLVACDINERKGLVIASSDDPAIFKLKIDLGKYPEIIHTIRTEKTLVLDNLASDPTMHFLTKTQKTVAFNSMVVCPIKIGGNHWGVLSARMPEAKKEMEEFEVRFSQILGHVCGLLLAREADLRSGLKFAA